MSYDSLVSLVAEAMHTLMGGKHSGNDLALESFEITYPDESTASVHIQLKMTQPGNGPALTWTVQNTHLVER